MSLLGMVVSSGMVTRGGRGCCNSPALPSCLEGERAGVAVLPKMLRKSSIVCRSLEGCMGTYAGCTIVAGVTLVFERTIGGSAGVDVLS